MTVKIDCPRCGPVHACDECGKIIEKPYLSAKVVLNDKLAACPIVWGEWCGRDCFLDAVAGALEERKVA